MCIPIALTLGLQPSISHSGLINSIKRLKIRNCPKYHLWSNQKIPDFNAGIVNIEEDINDEDSDRVKN